MSLDDALIQTHLASAVVDRITAITTLSIGRPVQEVALPLDICFGYPSDDWSSTSLDDVTLFHTQSSDLSASELADLLEAAFFSPHEDSDADCYDTQLDNFQEEALERAIRTLLSDEAALKARIEMTLDRHLRWVMPSTLQVEVIVSPITSDALNHWSGFRRVVTILP